MESGDVSGAGVDDHLTWNVGGPGTRVGRSDRTTQRFVYDSGLAELPFIFLSLLFWGGSEEESLLVGFDH